VTSPVVVGADTLASDYNNLRAASDRRPVVRIVQATAQSIANNTTDTSVTFGAGSTDIDTHSFHSEVTNNTRITPLIAGIYRFTGTIVYAAVGAAGVFLAANLAKNGTPIAPRTRLSLNASSQQRSVSIDAIYVSMNGSTDYCELQTVQSTGGALLTTVGSPYASVFNAEYVRSL